MGGGMSIEMWLAENDEIVLQSELQRKVFEELAFEPAVDAADVRVTVDDRVVTLAGTVRSYPEKLAVERAAKRVSNVQGVRNHLTVTPPPSDQRSDRDLEQTTAQVLKSDVLASHARVQAAVAQGWVQLVGEVSRDAERRAVEEAVQRLLGVKGVTNRIVLRPTSQPADLQAHVKAAVERSSKVHGNHVKVETHGGSVLLQGRVPCLAEREEIEQAVWSVPGVTSVSDELRVGH